MELVKSARTLSLLVVGLGLAVNASAQSFLTNGLVAYYPFNGDVLDASGNGANPTATSVAQAADRFGRSGKAATFNGSSSVLTLPSGRLLLAGSSTATISEWVRLDSTNAGEQMLFAFCIDAYYAPPPSPVGLALSVLPPGQLNVWTASDSDRNFSTTLFATNVWCHLVVVYDGQATANSNKIKMYFNGIQDRVTQVNPQVIPAAIPESANGSWIGARSRGLPADYMISYLAGTIDDIRIYNRALSSTEVAQLYAIESGPRVDLIKAVKPSFSYLSVGTNYQLQLSGDMSTWTNHGSPFTATNTSLIYPEYFDVENWGKLFFRLR